MIKRTIPKRSYSGEVWKTNKTNKKYLAIDFDNRCAYCDDLDKIYGGKRTYAVEHFAPKEKFPELEYVYDNLLYACSYCNGSKSDDWPSDDSKKNIVGDCGYIDPCSDEYYKHLDRDEESGKITYKTELGKFMFIKLKLFLQRHSLIYLIDKIQNKVEQLENSIDKDVSEGKDASKKIEVLRHCKEQVFDYYNLLQKQ